MLSQLHSSSSTLETETTLPVPVARLLTPNSVASKFRPGPDRKELHDIGLRCVHKSRVFFDIGRWRDCARLAGNASRGKRDGLLRRSCGCGAGGHRLKIPRASGSVGGWRPACHRAGHPARRIGARLRAKSPHSGGQDAALYGRQDSSRYSREPMLKNVLPFDGRGEPSLALLTEQTVSMQADHCTALSPARRNS